MGAYAWVTLATNDSYSLGALVLAHTLRQVGSLHDLVILVTPGVSEAMRHKLIAVFNCMKEVDILDSKDESNLRLLQRPELGITFTKLHCWRLTQYEKCVFLDADTMVLDNVDELFERDELSAAPDVGWPDCFNSGVFVYQPSEDTFNKLIEFALQRGSFDGGDQGLLNQYFSDWAYKDISKHLPFIYNMCSTACYSYIPAFKQFGINAKIIHFIGNAKPWLQYFDTATRQVQVSTELQHMKPVLQKWWDIFCFLIHPTLSTDMGGLAGAFAQLHLGIERTAEQTMLDDHLRRQCWEVGNIDYMGLDSFEHIWGKICQTLASPPPLFQPEDAAPAEAEGGQANLPQKKSTIAEPESKYKKSVESVETEQHGIIPEKVIKIGDISALDPVTTAEGLSGTVMNKPQEALEKSVAVGIATSEDTLTKANTSPCTTGSSSSPDPRKLKFSGAGENQDFICQKLSEPVTTLPFPKLYSPLTINEVTQVKDDICTKASPETGEVCSKPDPINISDTFKVNEQSNAEVDENIDAITELDKGVKPAVVQPQFVEIILKDTPAALIPPNSFAMKSNEESQAVTETNIGTVAEPAKDVNPITAQPLMSSSQSSVPSYSMKSSELLHTVVGRNIDTVAATTKVERTVPLKTPAAVELPKDLLVSSIQAVGLPEITKCITTPTASLAKESILQTIKDKPVTKEKTTAAASSLPKPLKSESQQPSTTRQKVENTTTGAPVAPPRKGGSGAGGEKKKSGKGKK